MEIPVLTYHSAYVSGDEYHLNDHVAFYHDIRLVHSLGLRVISLDAMVDRMLVGDGDLRGVVALTMDDATNFDYYDLPHPTCGMQRSMLNIMRDFVDEFGPGAQPHLHATSFVIASAEARTELDQKCLIGTNWYTDEWWNDAISSGLMGIANHSWDHNHPSLAIVSQRDQVKGSFLNIDTYEDADAQIRRAGELIASKTGGRASRVFAYPFGEVNEYLAQSYLPTRAAEHKLKAAFATRKVPDGVRNGIWTLPRLVCRDDWSSTDELADLLEASQRSLGMSELE
jgi:Polysaccharide deacetylase